MFDWFNLSGRVRRECLIGLFCLGGKTGVFDWFNLSGRVRRECLIGLICLLTFIVHVFALCNPTPCLYSNTISLPVNVGLDSFHCTINQNR